ncbi:RES family NAD+ phosphorylase [uncultured Azohydromonas sp.]|jgi:RES domain.|uniref:RES family NAD+ phosphorylase n=1 Tax=uncultured Azohydromonas sp. TaxID=487342 RepID=UPI00261C495C|nr:RES family NAD+ phosphorylase [uncultured Azohydromonas sp.]
MKLQELSYVPEHELPVASTLFRIQRARSRPGTQAIGPLRVSPPGTLAGRFDLAEQIVGYFAEGPETAIYETLARREAVDLSLADIGRRCLLALQTRQTMRLLDLRPHASFLPVLQSLRVGVTQRIAADASRLGFDGLVYRSAQHYGHDCYALFQPVLGHLKLLWRKPLLDPSGGPHHALLTALHGSQVPLVP